LLNTNANSANPLQLSHLLMQAFFGLNVKTQTGSPPTEVPNADGVEVNLKSATFDKSLAITRKHRQSQGLST